MILNGPPLVEAAAKAAARAHKGQTRANEVTPYLVHSETVKENFHYNWHKDKGWRMMPEFRGYMVDEHYRGCALALVHDTVEEDATYPYTFEQLSELGLESIIPELRLLTHFPGNSYLEYLLAIKSATHLPLARLVKICDMMANLSTVGEVPSVGARKGLRTKYELGMYILTH